MYTVTWHLGKDEVCVRCSDAATQQTAVAAQLLKTGTIQLRQGLRVAETAAQQRHQHCLSWGGTRTRGSAAYTCMHTLTL